WASMHIAPDLATLRLTGPAPGTRTGPTPAPYHRRPPAMGQRTFLFEANMFSDPFSQTPFHRHRALPPPAALYPSAQKGDTHAIEPQRDQRPRARLRQGMGRGYLPARGSTDVLGRLLRCVRRQSPPCCGVLPECPALLR